MQIHLRYFAVLREATGREAEDLALPEGATIEDARSALAAQYPSLARVLPACAASVNRSYVTKDAALAEGDELVFIPPLGGGAPLCQQ